MKVFYAHSKAIYGTPQEARDIRLLRLLGFDVLNPNEPQHQDGYKEFGMDFSRKLINQCDLLAFRAMPDGSIGAGVATEIPWAAAVIELPSGIDRRGLTVEQTRTWLKECGQR